MTTLMVVAIYALLAIMWKQDRSARVFYTQCIIMLTCLVLIVSNNMVRGDPWYGPLVFLGAASAIGMFLIQTRIMKSG